MRLKIRCNGESEKFCKIFWELSRNMSFYEYIYVFFLLLTLATIYSKTCMIC